MKLERDRLATKVGALEAQLHQLETSGKPDATAVDMSPTTKKVVRVAKLPDDRENPCAPRPRLRCREGHVPRPFIPLD